jgi:hypothetical protein
MPRSKVLEASLERRQEIVMRYREAGQKWPATSLEIADWALRAGQWKPTQQALRKQLAELLSDAMREDYITDPQGRRVRAKHAATVDVGGKQQVLWADIRDKSSTSRKHMEIAFQNRRQQIVSDCRQLKTDVDSYNDNWNSGESIQMVFDFTDDLIELEMMERTAGA